MARVRINLPEEYTFATCIPVQIADINYGGHLGNDALLRILHEARLQYLAHLGYSELRFGDHSLIMADAAIAYRGEGFRGDGLTVQIAATDFSKYGFDLVYRVTNQHGKEIAHAKTGLLCFNYDTRKLALLAASVRAKLENKQ